MGRFQICNEIGRGQWGIRSSRDDVHMVPKPCDAVGDVVGERIEIIDKEHGIFLEFFCAD